MKWIAGFLAALVMSMSVTFAVNTQASAQEGAKAVSSLDLKLRQIGEAFGDFVFTIKTIFTFDEKAKIELLKERNAELKARQQAWLETKAQAFAQFEAGVMPSEEKKETINSIQAEHEAIIKEHIRLTAEINNIELRAKARGDIETESRAELAAEGVEKSGLSVGLKIPVHADFAIFVGGEAKAITAEEAKTVVEEEMGFEPSDVRSEVRGGATFYVVSGTQTEISGDYTLIKNFEVWVQSYTGIITEVDMDSEIVSNNEANLEASGSAESGASISAVSSDASVQEESKTEPSNSASVGTQTSAGS